MGEDLSRGDLLISNWGSDRSSCLPGLPLAGS